MWQKRFSKMLWYLDHVLGLKYFYDFVILFLNFFQNKYKKLVHFKVYYQKDNLKDRDDKYMYNTNVFNKCKRFI